MYAYKTTTHRLQPTRIEDRSGFSILFRDRCSSEIGCINLTAFDDGFYVDYFEVYKPFREIGYGTEMYKWFETYAKRRGVERIVLAPYESAVGFWSKMGFKRPSRVASEMAKELRGRRRSSMSKKKSKQKIRRKRRKKTILGKK